MLQMAEDIFLKSYQMPCQIAHRIMLLHLLILTGINVHPFCWETGWKQDHLNCQWKWVQDAFKVLGVFFFCFFFVTAQYTETNCEGLANRVIGRLQK